MAADEQFEQFVAERMPALRNLAYLICGDWSAADDLTQDALIKSYGRWRSITTNPEAYVRRVLVTAAIDARRRPSRREHAVAELPEVSAPRDLYADVDARLSLRSSLLALPPRQRAAVALRYWLGLSLAEVADLLGCSVGTVKSQSAHGLAKLREALDTKTSARKDAP